MTVIIKMKEWSEKFNLPLPECGKCGICCLCATPSVSYKKLFERAAKGDQFARDFISIFVPYKNIDEARKVSKQIVNRTIKACQNGTNDIPVEDIVFYKCRYYHPEKKCLIYKDRPQLCRDYPSSPYSVMHDKCSFYNWSQECKKAYNKLKKDLEDLKNYKKELENLREQKRYEALLHRLKSLKDDEYRFMFTVPSMCVVSPGSSWIKIL